ncbi:hypothetical protein V6x_56520 [Gimesia chilikensis]|uniref:Uncharacterized protein n=1 Tax=Gimesia chilikensis TaxID=2605989 RepID=A0A517WKX3_9PLAN|nr:hypothetical protein [Gimesia chilikensis]QDU05908.1 hypothetical protein V6x_56520 [Gimesia chilikensis]
MTEEEWDECEDYFGLLGNIPPVHSIYIHRKIACEFARLVWNDLPPLGQEALSECEKLAAGQSDSEICSRYQKQLQELLIDGGESQPLSVVIWALQEDTASYPSHYSAQLAGLNIINSEAGTPHQLCQIIRKNIPDDVADMIYPNQKVIDIMEKLADHTDRESD